MVSNTELGLNCRRGIKGHQGRTELHPSALLDPEDLFHLVPATEIKPSDPIVRYAGAYIGRGGYANNWEMKKRSAILTEFLPEDR